MQQQSCGWRYYQPKLQHPVIKPNSFLYNRLASLGLALLGAVHEHPKNHNLFCAQVHFLDLSIQGHAAIQNLMKNLTRNLAFFSHTIFWVAFFSLFQNWHHAYLRRAYTKAEVFLHIGYHLGFLPHPTHGKMIPHPTQNIMTLFITFSPINQNILAWATLHSSVLHHCISSVLSCKPNAHFSQGPKNDYTHAYSHPLSKPFILPIAFLEPVSFLVTPFPIFHSHPIAF